MYGGADAGTKALLLLLLLPLLLLLLRTPRWPSSTRLTSSLGFTGYSHHPLGAPPLTGVARTRLRVCRSRSYVPLAQETRHEPGRFLSDFAHSAGLRRPAGASAILSIVGAVRPSSDALS